jgi:hypothetical protein
LQYPSGYDKNPKRKSLRMKKFILTSMCIMWFFVGVFPCDYNIRDAGFVNLNDLSYKLYFFIDDKTLAKSIEVFKEESLHVLNGSNILPVIVHVSRDRDHKAMEHYRFWDLQDLPAFILTSPDQRTLPLYIPNDMTVNRDNIQKVLQNTVSSSVREEILAYIVKAYAVLILIEGPDPEENRSAFEKIKKASQKIDSVMSQLPKRIETPPHIIVIPHDRTMGERIFLWSLDLNSGDMDRARLAILFGRGRIFYSPFESSLVSASEITDMLTIIGLSCDCGLDKKDLIGQSIPLRWDENLQTEVVKYLGFDAENPLIKREIAGILAANNLDAESGEALGGPLRELGQYREKARAFSKKLDSFRISPALSQRFSPQSSVRSRSGFNYLVLLLLAGFVLTGVLVGAIYIRIRAKRERP